jgi:hypothetical protein
VSCRTSKALFGAFVRFFNTLKSSLRFKTSQWSDEGL